MTSVRTFAVALALPLLLALCGCSWLEFTNPRAREEVSLMVGEVMDKLGMEADREVLRKFVNTPMRLTGGAGGL